VGCIVGTVERILKKLRTISYSKGSGLGASLLDEAGSSLPKQGVVH